MRYQSQDNPEKPTLANLAFYPRRRLLRVSAARTVLDMAMQATNEEEIEKRLAAKPTLGREF